MRLHEGLTVSGYDPQLGKVQKSQRLTYFFPTKVMVIDHYDSVAFSLLRCSDIILSVCV